MAPLLACPDCEADLGPSLVCACGFAGQGRDLRPQHPKARRFHFVPGAFAPREVNDIELSKPRNVYRGPHALRDSSELFSAIEPHLHRGRHLLDLGCGPRDQAIVAEHYGLAYTAVDFDSQAADYLADAHALPFRAQSFDIVLSYAVLEHLYNPFAAVREIHRVLKDGGVFIGTVSQGEPFHDSYFHHTAWGTLAVLRAGGLRVTRLWPSYDTLHALARMGRYARPQRLLIEAVHRFIRATPFLAPRKFFHWAERDQQLDALHRAAGICFVAVK